jgi:hypothetical protein
VLLDERHDDFAGADKCFLVRQADDLSCLDSGDGGQNCVVTGRGDHHDRCAARRCSCMQPLFAADQLGNVWKVIGGLLLECNEVWAVLEDLLPEQGSVMPGRERNHAKVLRVLGNDIERLGPDRPG